MAVLGPGEGLGVERSTHGGHHQARGGSHKSCRGVGGTQLWAP